MRTNAKIQKLIQIDYCLKNYAYMPIEKEECLQLFEDYCSEEEFDFLEDYLDLRIGDYCGIFLDDLCNIDDDNEIVYMIDWGESVIFEKIPVIIGDILSQRGIKFDDIDISNVPPKSLWEKLRKQGVLLDDIEISAEKQNALAEIRKYDVMRMKLISDIWNEISSLGRMKDYFVIADYKLNKFEDEHKEQMNYVEQMRQELAA